MRVRRLTIRNFRGVKYGVIDFPKHALLVGGNNVGKSTICEALDLVLGPERLYRRPVVDEHDFYRGHYLPDAPVLPEGLEEGEPGWDAAVAAALERAREETTIRIEVVLTELSDEAERRFAANLRRWNHSVGAFVDEEEAATLEDADGDGVVWALPVAFFGRYNLDEDDFEGGTFLTHPVRPVDEDQAVGLGAGLATFTRESKRLCGYVFLRALRTGSRALTLQKGSLLDTILRLSSSGAAEMWTQTLRALRELDPAIGEIPQLQAIRDEVQGRARQFITLAPGAGATTFFASDLTRESLRELVSLFVATDNGYLLPFQRHGTGTVNVLVFALLTYIADVKAARSVIFAMEEPEIALPPHTQRRVARFVLREMGQAVVTSHSPYVIEQFDSSEIVVLTRSDDGQLHGRPLGASLRKERTYRTQRRQFAEAVLARAVLVVEGATEVVAAYAVSESLERLAPPGTYTPFDLDGVTLFDAGSDSRVPPYGPVFTAMDKVAFAFTDKQKTPWSAADTDALKAYTHFEELQYEGIEDLLAAEVGEAAQRRFLGEAAARDDYPQVKSYAPTMAAEDVRALTRDVLIARKGDSFGHAGLLIGCCESVDELPATIVRILSALHDRLRGADSTRSGALQREDEARPNWPVQ